VTERTPPLCRLNWGCGDQGEPGWVNSDLKEGPSIEIVADIRDGLPVDDETFAYVVSIHALPMVSYPDLVPALCELHRVLQAGGVLRLCLPDLDKGLAALVEGRAGHFAVPDDEVTSLSGKFIVHMLWYGWSVTLFTAEFIEELLRKAGFREVHHCHYLESSSRLPGITDLDNREHESLYIEALK
jgi:SAM-dependent methyltransferase